MRRVNWFKLSGSTISFMDGSAAFAAVFAAVFASTCVWSNLLEASVGFVGFVDFDKVHNIF